MMVRRFFQKALRLLRESYRCFDTTPGLLLRGSLLNIGTHGLSASSVNSLTCKSCGTMFISERLVCPHCGNKHLTRKVKSGDTYFIFSATIRGEITTVSENEEDARRTCHEHITRQLSQYVEVDLVKVKETLFMVEETVDNGGPKT